jgi:hypothetical protein
MLAAREGAAPTMWEVLPQLAVIGLRITLARRAH